jgi:hypothetical protein
MVRRASPVIALSFIVAFIHQATAQSEFSRLDQKSRKSFSMCTPLVWRIGKQ